MNKFIRCGRDLTVNRDEVASVRWDRRHYMNGPGDSFLVITMNTGEEHRIAHQPFYLDGTDCYKIEEAIINA